LTLAICCLLFQPTLNFIEFLEALRWVATLLRCTLNEIVEKIVLVSAPLSDQ
jgi:hypothetical protein